MNSKKVEKCAIMAVIIGLLIGCIGEGYNTTQQGTITPATDTPTATLLQEVSVAPAKTQTPAPTDTPTPEPTATPAPTDTPTPSPEPTPTPRFWDKFVVGEPVVEEDSYRSETVAVFLTSVADDSNTYSIYPLVYHIADIYLSEPTDFRSAFTHENFHYRYAYPMEQLVRDNNAMLAISGDFIRSRTTGLCVRNGVVYRKTHDPSRDVCVFYRDGHIETFDATATPVDTILNDPEVWHVIGFGPSLLDEEGKAKEKFHTGVGWYNPRVVIGYYEPGHYAFLYVEGRQDGYSQGLQMQGLSKLCESLGFSVAFNLDGGETARMYFCGNSVGRHYSKRPLHDIFYIAYP